MGKKERKDSMENTSFNPNLAKSLAAHFVQIGWITNKGAELRYKTQKQILDKTITTKIVLLLRICAIY